ncbi:MAG: helix-turn-helix domain-containing protein [Myxococcota bacterium]
MAFADLMAELREADDSPATWRPVARTLARLASQGRGTQLRALVAELAELRPSSEWGAGFAEALCTVGNALDRSLRDDQARAELVTMAASTDWQRVLPLLTDWITPTELAQHTAIHKAQLSRVLANMQANDIVEVQRGQTDGRRRFFRLTLRGARLVEETGLGTAETVREERLEA